MLTATNFVSQKSLRKTNCMKHKTSTLTVLFSNDFFLPIFIQSPAGNWPYSPRKFPWILKEMHWLLWASFQTILRKPLFCVLQKTLDEDLNFIIICWLSVFLVLTSISACIRCQLCVWHTVYVWSIRKVCNCERATKWWTLQVSFCEEVAVRFTHVYPHVWAFVLEQGCHFL